MILLWSPGSGKCLAGLYYPGVEQHVFGSSEEDTALNFPWRTDILPHVTFPYIKTLTPEDTVRFTADTTSEEDIGRLTRIARARSIIKYRQYLRRLAVDLNAGQRPELKTIFLDNFTPFSEDFQDYIQEVYRSEFATAQGNFNSIRFSIVYNQELASFLRDLVQLPCHVVMSCHIAMSIDEETAAIANFMEDSKKGIRREKEWQPFVMGKLKYALTGIFTHAFYLYTESQAGLPTKYYAKLEADANNLGIGKSRVGPFKNPRRIEFPKGKMFETFDAALQSCITTGQPV